MLKIVKQLSSELKHWPVFVFVLVDKKPVKNCTKLPYLLNFREIANILNSNSNFSFS